MNNKAGIIPALLFFSPLAKPRPWKARGMPAQAEPGSAQDRRRKTRQQNRPPCDSSVVFVPGQDMLFVFNIQQK